ncbi:MAG: hypothetical protein H6Q63_1161, partial [Firmicutes bacterium]|nr:hypothetical protein [Bacillota bacterium]
MRGKRGKANGTKTYKNSLVTGR